MQRMQIPATAKLIADCWDQAEQALRVVVREKFPDRDEEIITELFHSELAVAFEKASTIGKVSRAFQSDLKRAFPRLDESKLQSNIAAGLVATVSFHSRSMETKTGGDLGIALVRPDVEQVRYSDTQLIIDKDYRRGLLCQAKIFRRKLRWGPLSRTESVTLSDKLSYASLLLYRYADQSGERRDLNPFMWQLMAGATIPQISQWLSLDKFPNPCESRQILRALGADQIGTDDKEIIERDITPPLRPSLIIRIGWRGDGPGDTVSIHQPYSIAEQIVQRY